MDFFFLAPLLEMAALKLGAISADQDSGGAKSCEDVLPHELYHLSTRDRDQ